MSQRELRILQNLCNADLSQSEWAIIQEKLAAYAWREPDHAVVYRSILRARARDSRDWRSQLAGQATLMGFPEIDWNAFLGPEAQKVSEPELHQLIRELCGS